jgi:two-component system sensor histidine kinase KdpD
MTTLQWAHNYRQVAGLDTGTQPQADVYYLPLVTANHSPGVLALLVDYPVTMANQRLLNAFATQAALALEAAQRGEEARQANLFHEKEKLQAILLNSISHDLRTPLVSITGTLSSLLDYESQLDSTAQHDLLVDALSEAERLNHLVRNLLDISRLEAGSLRFKLDLYDLSEIIGVARTQLRDRLGNRQFIIHLEDGLPMVEVDITLFSQVFTNLLDNAIKYSDDNFPLEIRACQIMDEMQVMVGDRGIGIPDQDMPHIFDKFFRASNIEQRVGSGLGLAICQGIVEAHGGRMSIQNRPEGGTWFIIHLPLEKEKT